MKRLLFITILLISKSAFSAGVWTAPGILEKMDEYGQGLRVYGLDLSANPANCQHTGSAMMTAGESSVKNRLNSVLLSAFISSQKVQIKLNSTICESGHPVYYGVRVVR